MLQLLVEAVVETHKSYEPATYHVYLHAGDNKDDDKCHRHECSKLRHLVFHSPKGIETRLL